MSNVRLEPKIFFSFFFSSRRRHTRCSRDWSSDVCSSDLPTGLTGSCARVDGPAVVPGATWYEAQRENDGLEFRFAPGALAEMRFLSADIFADSPELPVFQLRLREGEDGPMFTLSYGVLPYAEARMRMRAEAVNQNRWQFLREGAWLKPSAGAARVDLAKVDRLTIGVLRKSQRPVRWC